MNTYDLGKVLRNISTEILSDDVADRLKQHADAADLLVQDHKKIVVERDEAVAAKAAMAAELKAAKKALAEAVSQAAAQAETIEELQAELAQ